MNSANDHSTRTATRATAAIQLLLMFAAAALLIPAMTPASAVLGGPVLKLLFLGRVAALVALATWFLRQRTQSWSDVGLGRPHWKIFFIAIPLGLIAGYTLAGAAASILARFGFQPPNYRMFSPIKGNFPAYLFWLLPVSWGSAALGEELIFRGFMLDTLKLLFGREARGSTAAAILSQAVIFGVLHFYQGAEGVAITGVIGLVLGLVWFLTGRNLWAGIIIHGLMDSAAMTAIYFGWTGP